MASLLDVRRAVVLVTTAALLAGCTATAGHPALRLDGGRSGPTVTAPKIRIVQANLRIGTPVKKFQADVHKVLSVRPDFVTYDEVAHRHASVLAPAGYRVWRQGGVYKGEAAVAWNSRRWHLIDHGVTMLTDRPGRVPGANYAWGIRYANWVTLRSYGGLTLSVVAAHFPPSTKKTEGLTVPAAMRLGALSDRLARHGAVLVGGDLNVTYHSADYPRAIFKRHGLLSTYDALQQRVVTSGSNVTLDYVLVRGFARFALGHQFRLRLHSDHDGVGVDLAPLPARIGPSAVRFGQGTVLSDPHGGTRERNALVRVALKAIRSAERGATVHLALRRLDTPVVVKALVAAHSRHVHVQVIAGSGSGPALARLSRLLGSDPRHRSWAVYEEGAFARLPATTLLVNRSGATRAFRLTARAPVGRVTNHGWHRAEISTTRAAYRLLFRAFRAAVGR